MALATYPAVAAGQATIHPSQSVYEHIEAVEDIEGPNAQKDQGAPLDFLAVPIPQSSPSLGNGITLVGAVFYNPVDGKEPWVSGIGAMRTSNGSWGVGAGHKMSLSGDKYRAGIFVGYGDVNIRFFGIGPNAGDGDQSILLNERGLSVVVQGQTRIANNLYGGARLNYLSLNTRILRDNPRFPELEIPQPDFDTRLAGIGPVLVFDRRDRSLNPKNGEYVTASWIFNSKALGSDFKHNKFSLAANAYRSIGKNTVFATRVSVCNVSEGGPFYDLCMYGGSDLRGYEWGRYRDNALWATQVELRQHLFGRVGGVLFAGVGGTATSFTSIGSSTALPAGGIGLRFQPSRETPINLRIDYALGKNANALYLSIGESF